MDHIPTTARASARTMDNLVIPALLESGDGPAVEQAHLIRDFLQFVADRVHLVGPRIAFQLRHAVGLAESVVVEAGHPTGSAVVALSDALAQARGAESLEPDELMDLMDLLQRRMFAVVRRTSEHGDGVVAARLQRLVLDAMRERVEADRAWLAPMGFDPEPSTIGDLHALHGIGSEHNRQPSELSQERQ
ncbi:hypothetical protein [Rhodococcus sp. T7]|uniref:hypothetical protein n=1 Tax=Rhodococcus sp. T7 TaxID=627444 RepID=UPI0013589630|nr:hypothetical protein [Rhodococcus sp. T7]KAF0957159.1 hypothetical protein MLGJGCBP_08989 [Rhodococcus sp. T7]KAF0958997.1 hypothetical protein MLGJGCBP_07874 [Rhodococcus sp. T7]